MHAVFSLEGRIANAGGFLCTADGAIEVIAAAVIRHRLLHAEDMVHMYAVSSDFRVAIL